MFTLITSNGKDLIADADTSANKISITSFQIGDFIGNLDDLRLKENDYNFLQHPNLLDVEFVEANFEVKHSGTATHIRYILVEPDTVIIKFFVPQDVPTFVYDSLLIYGTINGSESLFCWSYSLYTNPKFSTVTDRTGTKYYLLLNLKVANRDDRFDFSNLTMEEAEFGTIDSYYNVPDGPKTLYDQFILEHHEQSFDNGPYMTFNSQDQFFVTPLIEKDFDIEDDLTISSDLSYYSNVSLTPPLGFEILLDENEEPVVNRQGQYVMVRSI